MNHDFYIVTKPHSGSHMLASAINSHPDVSCGGEYGFVDRRAPYGEGQVVGCITHMKAFNSARGSVSLDDVDKVIVLVRHNGNDLMEFTRDKDRLILCYEEMTDNRNIHELPDKDAANICRFLNVKYHPLFPAMKKNKVAIV